MATPKVNTTLTLEDEAPKTQAPQAPTAPAKQAYKCVHTPGLAYNGAEYKAGQRYVFTEADLYEGGWLDCQVKAKLFEPTE